MTALGWFFILVPVVAGLLLSLAALIISLDKPRKSRRTDDEYLEYIEHDERLSEHGK